MLIFVRHGKTASNEVGSERLRGWLPIPLDLEGMQQAEEVAEELSQVEGVKEIRCATLVRVVQSAHEIGEELGMVITPMEELNDLDTGDLAGQPVSDTIDAIKDHIRNPNKKLPGGETVQFFFDRIIPVLRECVESKDLYIVVSSGRVGTLLAALSKNKGKHPDTDTMLGKPPIENAGILVLDNKWNITFKTKKSEEAKSLS